MATVTLNTSWQRFEVTATNQAGLSFAYFQIGGGGTMTAGQSICIWGAQMVVGSSQGAYVETENTTTVTGSPQTLAANGLNEVYSYDSFGNLQSTGNYNFIQAYTSANQISGWTYDAAGNLLYDGLGNAYQYNAESLIKSGAGGVYGGGSAGGEVRCHRGGYDLFWGAADCPSLRWGVDGFDLWTRRVVGGSAGNASRHPFIG
jgi:hypothetical protein